jgi:hypothetical protein
MILDNEEQKEMLSQIINRTNFPGAVIELAVELKQAVAKAIIAEVKDSEEK